MIVKEPQPVECCSLLNGYVCKIYNILHTSPIYIYIYNAEITLKRISQLCCFNRIPIRIPKSCRTLLLKLLAMRFAGRIPRVEYGVEQLGHLPYPRLGHSDQSKYDRVLSLSSIIRANIRRLARSHADLDTLCQQLPCHHARKETSSSEKVRSHINSKLMQNDVKAAIRVVASYDTIHEVTPEVLQSHRPTRLSEREDSLAPTIPADNIAVSADQNNIMRSLPSFFGGCRSGGIDGLRPAHLLNLILQLKP